MSIKKSICILICMGIILVSVGCQMNEEAQAADYQVVVQDYAELILQQDELSEVYDEALDAVGVYLDGDVELVEVQEFVEESIYIFDDFIVNYESYELTDDMADRLELCDINAQEYKIVNNMFISDVGSYVTNLESLQWYLSLESEEYSQTEALNSLYSIAVSNQELNRAYTYCSINYWFASWEDDMLVYVQEGVLEQLQSIYIENYFWEDNQKDVENKGEKYLLEMLELEEELAKLIGEQQELWYEMEAGSY